MLTLQIRLLNRAGVPRGVIAGIQREAIRVFHEAGIQLSVRDCRAFMGFLPQACTEPAGPTELLVELLPGQCPHRTRVLGYERAGVYAAIFVGRADDLASEQIATREDILAHAIAHEADHMLTGDRHHSGGGIMHAVWGLHDLELIASRSHTFHPKEISEMRAALARIQIVAAALAPQ